MVVEKSRGLLERRRNHRTAQRGSEEGERGNKRCSPERGIVAAGEG